MVHTMQLVSVRKISPAAVARCLKRHPTIQEVPCHIPSFRRGYIGFADARKICRSFHIESRLIDQMEKLANEGEPEGHAADGSPADDGDAKGDVQSVGLVEETGQKRTTYNTLLCPSQLQAC